MLLKYIGKTLEEAGGVVPLPEGWPASDHEEPDKDLAREKIKSGNYEAAKPVKAGEGDGE